MMRMMEVLIPTLYKLGVRVERMFFELLNEAGYFRYLVGYYQIQNNSGPGPSSTSACMT